MEWPLQICFLIKSFLEFQVWPWCHNEKFWPLTANLMGTKIRLACCNWGGFLSSLTLSQEFCFFVFLSFFLNAMQGLTGGLEGFVLFAVWQWHSQVLHFKCSTAFFHKSTFPVFSSLVPSCALEGILFPLVFLLTCCVFCRMSLTFFLTVEYTCLLNFNCSDVNYWTC